MWRQQPPNKSQLDKSELKEYLMSNPYTPVYIVSKEDVITSKLVYDEDQFLGFNYLKLNEEGVPQKVKIPVEKYLTLLSKISDNYLIYTLHGMKLTLDKLDKLSK